MQRRSAFWYTAPPIFAAWLILAGLLIHRQIVAAGSDFPTGSVLQYQPSPDVQWYVVEQRGVPVGYTIRHIGEEDAEGTTHYRMTETRALAASVNGLFVRTKIDFKALTDEHFRLLSFSGTVLFQDEQYVLNGEKQGTQLHLTVQRNGSHPEVRDVPLEQAQALPVSFEPFLASQTLRKGKRYRLKTLDPVTLQAQNTVLTVLGPATIENQGKQIPVTQVQVEVGNATSTLSLDRAANIVQEVTGENFLETRSTRDMVLRLRKALQL